MIINIFFGHMKHRISFFWKKIKKIGKENMMDMKHF